MIYDCFPFNGEYDLLEIRLNHHSQFVDWFVISEATYTYSGKPKPLYFEQVRGQEPFVSFKDQIFYVVFDQPPEEGKENWIYEHRQRDYLKTLVDCLNDDDLILYMDCDEIIRDESVIEIAMNHKGVSTLQLKLCWYYFNCMVKPMSKRHKDYSMEKCFKDGWYMGKICRKEDFQKYPHAYNLRQDFLWNREEAFVIPSAGWHFSNLGEAQSIYAKLMAFSHSEELSMKYDITPELINQRKGELLDPLGREGVEFEKTPLDVPYYIKENMQKYIDKGYIL